ncbi:MAG: hypothetical protein JW864_09690 [Spirochaetes bacterium]|nr:hypothetical protein [Spirochaetota bacterium]
MLYLNNFFNLIFDPFRKADPVWPVLIVSLAAGIFVMIVFRMTLNSKRVKFAKRRIIAHLLEIPLYKDNIRILLSAQKNILRFNLKFLTSILKPVLIVIIPMSVCVFQMQKWLGYEPLSTKGSAVFRVILDDKNAFNKISIEPGEGINIDTPALRIAEDNEISWRISADKPGRHNIKINIDDSVLYKNIIAADDTLVKLTPRIILKPGFYKLLYPSNKSLTADTNIREIAIDYKPRTVNLPGLEMHWLVLFSMLTIVFGLVFKKLLGVRM